MRKLFISAYCWVVVLGWMFEEGKSLREIINAIPKHV